jgi:mono/diheme cytochrome c family protein
VKSLSLRSFVWLTAALLLASCGKKESDEQPAPTTGTTQPAPTPSPATGDPVAAAKKVFIQRCVPCHGATGQGDGPASATLDPKPRKYADKEWQASVTDEYLEKAIKFGGAGIGKSPAMPNNPDLSPEVVTALKDLVRAFGK